MYLSSTILLTLSLLFSLTHSSPCSISGTSDSLFFNNSLDCLVSEPYSAMKVSTQFAFNNSSPYNESCSVVVEWYVVTSGNESVYQNPISLFVETDQITTYQGLKTFCPCGRSNLLEAGLKTGMKFNVNIYGCSNSTVSSYNVTIENVPTRKDFPSTEDITYIPSTQCITLVGTAQLEVRLSTLDTNQALSQYFGNVTVTGNNSCPDSLQPASDYHRYSAPTDLNVPLSFDVDLSGIAFIQLDNSSLPAPSSSQSVKLEIHLKGTPHANDNTAIVVGVVVGLGVFVVLVIVLYLFITKRNAQYAPM